MKQENMQMKSRLVRWFISMAQSFGFAKKRMLPVLSTSQPYLLHNIDTLLLKKFIDCYTGKSLTGLIISGKPTEQQLQDHFHSITVDYYDLIGSEASKTYVLLQKQVLRLSERVFLINSCFAMYLENRNEELKLLLSRNGFHFQKDQSNQLLQKHFQAFMKNLEIELSNKQKDVERYINTKKSAGEKATRETFLNNIIAMGKEGYVIDMDKIMTDMYALTFRSFNELMEAKLKAA